MRKFAQVTLVTAANGHGASGTPPPTASAANDKGTRCIRPHRTGC